MTNRFDYFVVLADMRTGSNFLEANINRFDGLTCHGEAFNGAFIGYPNRDAILDVTKAARDGAPEMLIDRIRGHRPGLGGFRYFSDHDPRALDIFLPDPRCAKIILLRNPLDSFISLQIARATGQWKLTNAKHGVREKVMFDPDAFHRYLDDRQAFQVRLLRGLQTTGQTAFYITFDDLHDLDVMNGLAAFLGCDDRIETLDQKMKRQNPVALEDKVTNPEAIVAAVADIDRFDLCRSPYFEPRRSPRVPHYTAAAVAPLLYMPLTSGPEDAVIGWLSALDGGAHPVTGFNRKSLVKWQAGAPGFRSFTVVRHPLARAHGVFCDRILRKGDGTFPEIRMALQQDFDVAIPDGDPLAGAVAGYDDAAHRRAFAGFLSFLEKNLAGQTGRRIDPAWASQYALLQGMAEVGQPDMIAREDRLEDDLAILCAQIGRTTMPEVPQATDPHAARLARIVDAELHRLGRAAYDRDYTGFGFADWVI